MVKKLLVLGLSTILLGGCSLNMFNTGNAAQDTQKEVMQSPSPSASPDQELEAMPTTSSSNDEKSLESDINSTTILNEDFSDLN